MSNGPSAPPPHFIVLVPGYMGSKLRHRRTGEIVWLDLPRLLSNPLKIFDAAERLFDVMKYPNPDLEPAGIIDQVIFVPPLFKQEQYGRLVEALGKWGYNVPGGEHYPAQPNVYAFDYDWRQDNRLSGRQLGEAVKKWRAENDNAKAWLIGHSNGGIISRWFIEKEGGHEHVDRLFLMGSPWDGAPKALQVLMDGLDVFLLRLFSRFDINEMTRDLVLTYPSFYQLFPSRFPFLQDELGQAVDPFQDTSWLKTQAQRDLLQDGKKFNEELGTQLSVESLCFFGVKHETTTGGVVHYGAGGRWDSIKWVQTEAGDGTVPQRSAVHPQAGQKLPYSAGHGDIYIVPPVLDKLEFELVTKYRMGVLATVTTSKYRVQFEPERDAVSPGEDLAVWAVIQNARTGAPVYDATVDVQFRWSQGLPGINEQPPASMPGITLSESQETAGRYEGSLPAPAAAGYYNLVATVQIEDDDPVLLEELVLVDQP